MQIIENIQIIRDRIHNACFKSGRHIDDVNLMAVSKFQAFAKIEEALRGGIKLFGESRIQEAKEKFTGFKRVTPEIEVHFIGNLQRNKAKAAVSLFDCIQSVDRESLIDELGVLSARKNISLKILFELHTGEETKSGFPDEEGLFKACERLLSYPYLIPAGLMTMAPYTNDESRIRASFRALVSARNKLESRFPSYDWSCLSMGMSNDFEIAIEEGSTLLRIGSAIFNDEL